MIYGFASVLGKIVAVLLMPIYTSILTKEEYGAMALITSCKGIIDIVSNLNIHSGIAREYYEDNINKKTLISTGFFSILTLSVIILIIGLLSHRFWAFEVLSIDKKYLIPFIIMLCSIPCGSLQSYFAILTRFKKKPVLYSIGTIIHLFIQISISIIGVVVLRKGISSVFFAILIAELFSIFYYGIINKEFLAFTFEKKHLKNALLFSIPTIPAILAGWIDNSFGQILIGKYVSLDDLGVYSIALSLASVFSFISIALNNVWYPFLYENYKKPSFPALLEKLYTIILAILILITVSISMFSKEIILLLANPNYIQASVYITLLCIPTCVYLLFPFVSSGVSISRDTKYIAISYIAGCILNFCCLLITLPRYGVIAVPISLALSRITTYIILYMVSSKKISIKLPNKLLIVLISTAVLCFIATKFHPSLLIRSIIVLGTFTSIFCYLFRHRTSFDMAKSLFKIKRSN